MTSAVRSMRNALHRHRWVIITVFPNEALGACSCITRRNNETLYDVFMMNSAHTVYHNPDVAGRAWQSGRGKVVEQPLALPPSA